MGRVPCSTGDTQILITACSCPYKKLRQVVNGGAPEFFCYIINVSDERVFETAIPRYLYFCNALPLELFAQCHALRVSRHRAGSNGPRELLVDRRHLKKPGLPYVGGKVVAGNIATWQGNSLPCTYTSRFVEVSRLDSSCVVRAEDLGADGKSSDSVRALEQPSVNGQVAYRAAAGPMRPVVKSLKSNIGPYPVVLSIS